MMLSSTCQISILPRFHSAFLCCSSIQEPILAVIGSCAKISNSCHLPIDSIIKSSPKICYLICTLGSVSFINKNNISLSKKKKKEEKRKLSGEKLSFRFTYPQQWPCPGSQLVPYRKCPPGRTSSLFYRK